MNLSPSSAHHHHHHHRHRRHSSRHENDQDRTEYIIETFLKNFSADMRENPKGWRSRFRKMAENEFAFYRGSAVLFYRDLYDDLRHDRWLNNCPQATRIFIHVRISTFFLSLPDLSNLDSRVTFMQKISGHTSIDMASLISMSMISTRYFTFIVIGTHSISFLFHRDISDPSLGMSSD